jgi:hypothetical protein
VVKPERRTRGDLVAVAMIVVVGVAVATLLWRFSDARATASEPATGPGPVALVEPNTLPPSLAQVWSAPSAATPVPVVVGSTVVTADGSEVIGRDPLTGERRWRFARDIDLCTVTAAWGNALTLWSKDPRYCSEVSALGGDTGRSGAQRNGDAERGTRVLFDGSHVTVTGSRYLETWRSDLVRTNQWGQVPAIVNPNKQPRTGCTYASVAAASNQVAVSERCPDGNRLTVFKANPKESDLPEEIFSVRTDAPAALVVAVTTQRVAVLLAGPNRLAVYDLEGVRLAEYPMTAQLPSTADGLPAIADTTVTPNFVYWFTGSSTVALDITDLRPQWTLDGSLGPGAMLAGRLLVPAEDELVVLDAVTGERVGATPVDRAGYEGPVRLATAGAVVLEQRGPLLAALR